VGDGSESSEKAAPLVCAVVLNFNGRQHLNECFSSLRAQTYPHLEILMVDNQSSDDSVAYTVSNHAYVNVIPAGGNLGWSGGNNVGVREALKRGADFVWILNNDIRVEPDALARLVAYSDTHPDECLLACTFKDYFNPDITTYSFGGIDLDACMAGHALTPAEFRSRSDDRKHVSGAAMFISRDVFERIGLFDERSFIYNDDTDFCLRAAHAGFHQGLAEDAVIHHKESAFSGGKSTTSPWRAYHSCRSGLHFWRKQLGWWKFHRRCCPGYASKWLAAAVKAEAQGNGDVAQVITDAFWYHLQWKKDPLTHPVCPDYMKKLMLSKPWLFTALLSFDARLILRSVRLSIMRQFSHSQS
jgi:GT2 family glycosyltransferase